MEILEKETISFLATTKLKEGVEDYLKSKSERRNNSTNF